MSNFRKFLVWDTLILQHRSPIFWTVIVLVYRELPVALIWLIICTQIALPTVAENHSEAHIESRYILVMSVI